jgi:hypothetical protein
MRQNSVGEPAATAALNSVTPQRRSSLNRLCPEIAARIVLRSLCPVGISWIWQNLALSATLPCVVDNDRNRTALAAVGAVNLSILWE